MHEYRLPWKSPLGKTVRWSRVGLKHSGFRQAELQIPALHLGSCVAHSTWPCTREHQFLHVLRLGNWQDPNERIHVNSITYGKHSTAVGFFIY